MIHLLILVGFLSSVASAAVSNVRILGVTGTQSIIGYTAPDASACTVEVSEESDYTPLVHDVNGTHFTGDNLDSRTGAITRGRERTVVIGKRTIERSAAGPAYSRALQAATLHYYRITCGGDSATGTFSTASIPFGNSHGDPVIPDPTIAGRSMQTTPLFTRNAEWVDPHSGALHKRVSQPQDQNGFLVVTDAQFTSVLESTNWTNPNNVLAADATNATYAGSSCAATCDWLKLTRDMGPNPGYQERLDAIRISINGSGDNATAANRTVEVCPITLGATTIDANGVCKDLILPQTTPSKVITDVSGLVDTWRVAGSRELTLYDVHLVQHFRFAVRKKNSTGNLTIDAVRIDWWKSTPHSVGTGGSYDRCSSVTRTDNDGERYLCGAYTAGAPGNLYSIHSITGDARFLGAMKYGSYAINLDHMPWDATNPNRFYGTASGDPSTDSYSFTYSGNGADKSAGHVAEFTTTALRSTTNENMSTAVQTFTTAHSGEYPVTYDPAKYLCSISTAQGDYLHLDCKRGNADTLAWLAVYRISTQTIIGAMPMFAAPASRWCVLHARDTAGNSPATLISTSFGKDQILGNGSYRSVLVGAITSGTTNVVVTSTCGGSTCTGHVTGEPVSATYDDNYVQPAAVGDVFVIDSEYVRITAKADATHWTIARAQFSSTAASHSDGATFNAMCANATGAGPTQYVGTPMLVWNPLTDPYGMDATGTSTWLNAYVGHQSDRLNIIVNNKSIAITSEGADILSTVRDPTYSINLTEAPYFAGKSPPGPGNTYQQHPAFHHVTAPLGDRQFFWDVRPLEGGNAMGPTTIGCSQSNPIYPASGGCAAKRVSGLTNVYQVVVTGGIANPDGLHPKHLALFGVSRISVLHDVSGPGSVLDDSAGKDYAFCYAIATDECVTGSSAGNLYVQVPLLDEFYCNTSGGLTGVDVCMSEGMAVGSALGQFGWVPNREGLPSSDTNSTSRGSAWTRELSKHGSNSYYRLISLFSTGKALANGKWVLVTDWMESYGGGLLAIVKVPPNIKDTVNRSSFLPVAIKIGSVPTGTSTILAEFGYSEFGTPTQFRCTTRAETCVAVESAVNLTTPFYYSSETYSRLSCASGCTITLPVLPSRVAYYRIKYYNAGGSLIATGPVDAVGAY